MCLPILCHYFLFSAQIVQGVKEAAVACEEEQMQMMKNSRKDEIEALEHEILAIRYVRPWVPDISLMELYTSETTLAQKIVLTLLNNEFV